MYLNRFWHTVIPLCLILCGWHYLDAACWWAFWYSFFLCIPVFLGDMSGTVQASYSTSYEDTEIHTLGLIFISQEYFLVNRVTRYRTDCEKLNFSIWYECPDTQSLFELIPNWCKSWLRLNYDFMIPPDRLIAHEQLPDNSICNRWLICHERRMSPLKMQSNPIHWRNLINQHR